MLHLTFSMTPNIVFAPNIHRTQNTDTGRKTQTQLISALQNIRQQFTIKLTMDDSGQIVSNSLIC